MNHRLKNIWMAAVIGWLFVSPMNVSAQDLFKQGLQEYRERQYDQAAKTFGRLAATVPPCEG